VVIHKSILIKQNGFYSVEWDLETNQPSSETQVTGRLSNFFGHFAEFDENITVGNLMLILGDFSDEINLIFNGYLNGVDFDLFLQESMVIPTSIPSIDYIELAWKVKMIAASDMTIIDIVPNIFGVSEIVGSDSDVITDLDFVQLRNLCKFNICEQTALDIPDDRTYQIAVEAEKRWTLFDIISGFLSEISRYGSPEEKQYMIDELNKESKLSFSELMDYVDEVEELSKEIEADKSGDLLDDDDDDE
jgi:hypothetical protein